MKNVRIGSWALFDFANSLYSINILTLYFALYFVKDLGGKEIYISMAYAAANLLLVLTAPWLGAISDHYGKKKPFLIFFTILCVVFTALLATRNHALALFSFALSVYGFTAGAVFYDSLLSSVSSKKNRGMVSGIGMATNFAGFGIGIFLIGLFVSGNRANAFLPTSLFFLLFAIPCFLFVRENSPVLRKGTFIAIAKANFHKSVRTLKSLRDYPGIFRLFIARFLYNDAANTFQIFIALYAAVIMDMPDNDFRFFAAITMIAALAGSVVSGSMIGRIGAKKMLQAGLLLGIASFGIITVINVTDRWLMWPACFILGIAEGFIYSSERVLMLELSPGGRTGEFFGIYGMVSRFSAITGPLMWGFVILLFEGLGKIAAYRIAMGILLIIIMASFFVLRPLQEAGQTFINKP